MKTINISKVMFVQFRIDWENFIFLLAPLGPQPASIFHRSHQDRDMTAERETKTNPRPKTSMTSG
jgi:hypothetical protein